jgi:AbrB family looped-hinge helix DNA binding protein
VEARIFHSSVSPKGQITLPVEIRRQLGIFPKDTVEIEMTDGRVVQLRAAKSRIARHYGVAKPLRPPREWKEVEAIAREEMAENAYSEDKPD